MEPCLDVIRLGTLDDVGDANAVALSIIDPFERGFGTMSGPDKWARWGCPLLTATLLHVLYTSDSRGRSLSAAAQILAAVASPNHDILHEMLEAQHDREYRRRWIDERGALTGTHPFVTHAVSALLQETPVVVTGTAAVGWYYIESQRIAPASRSRAFALHERRGAAALQTF